MKERPIIFSDAMVLALLDGRKTQTRRVVKPQPEPFVQHTPDKNPQKHPAPYLDAYCSEKKTTVNPRGMSDRWCWWTRDNRQGDGWYRCPYGTVGDRLWVRETWCIAFDCAPDDGRPISLLGDVCLYRATEPETENEDGTKDCKWRPSIHMPRWASRITLEITGVRVERVQDISDEDAKSEGTAFLQTPDHQLGYRDFFSDAWDSIYSASGYGWGSNPWVWVIEFKKV